ncbi:MAG: hypothetical protein ACTSQG_12040 [Promethearchaeota archaeon]
MSENLKRTQTNAEDVKEFTEGYLNMKCPDKPIAIPRDQVFFLIRMVMSELDELACTVTQNEEECNQFMLDALKNIDKCQKYNYDSQVTTIGAQADACVDAWYYMLNIAAKHGQNLSKLFDVIHAANMDKRDPETKQFLRRSSDGKVMKRPGWKEPNIDAVINQQMIKGSWR